MPDSLMPIVVSSGLGVGVIAGVVSGICYVFIQGFRSTGTRRSNYVVTNPWQCCICGAHFTPTTSLPHQRAAAISAGAASELRRFAVCAGCDGHACRATCGGWLRGAWLCKQCEVNVSDKRGEQGWFRGILTALQPNAVTVRMSKSPASSSSAINSGNDGFDSMPQVPVPGPDDDKEVVRDFIERLVGAMLGANLDDTSVSRIYADAEYDAMFDRYHGDISAALTDLGSALHMSIANLPVTGQTPCTAHASLKNIIRRVLRDASNMAILKGPQNHSTELPDTTTNKTYEDLLATAILNKVIDNYQGDLRRSSSGSTSSRRSDSTGAHKRHKRGTGDQEWRNVTQPGDDTTSMSSVEEWCRSESSTGEKYVDHLSFTIQQSIEEITTSDEEQSPNQYLHSHNLSRNSMRNSEKEKHKNYLREDWQDNWLFSRKGKGSPKPVPVPMLVPNPSTDYRALIGDRDAEDTSDLSETGSDIEETDSAKDIKTILVESRTVIGGKNLLENVNTEYLETEVMNIDEVDAKVVKKNLEELKVKKEDLEESATNGDTGFEDDDVSEAKNNILIHETPYVESDSLGSNTEKDMEYTEKYASIPRQISKDKGPVPSPRKPKEIITDEPSEEIVIQAQSNGTEEHESNEESEEEFNEDAPPVNLRGSYSEKEIEKWRNPVALANNPYSKENLDKRLHNKTNMNDNYTFGRDYYIREAKKAAGGRHKFLNEGSNTEGSGQDSDQQSLQLTIENSDQNIFTAVPAVVQTDDEISEENEDVGELHSIPNSRPISLALSTDSEDVDVKRVYNIETGKVYTYKNNDFAKEIIKDSKSPEGTKFIVTQNELISSNLADEVDNKFDENHNKTYENTQKEVKEPIMNISNHIIALTGEKKSPGSKNKTLTKQEFLQQQISVDPVPEIEIITQKNEANKINITPELKESSKKYLQSLIKNKQQPEVVNNFSTPPISLQEYDTVDSVEKPKENKEENIAPLIDLDDDFTNTIDIQVEDTNILYKDYQSCIDLRFINEARTKSENDLLSPIAHNGFTISTPNLNDDKLYYPEDEERENEQKLNIYSELEELNVLPKPSVKDLKKLFDQEKQAKNTLSRSKSHLTTKPELKAHRQVHSLTARSLSKEFRRDILPELQKTTDLNHDNSIEINGVEEEKQEENQSEKVEEVDELKVIPPCKSKIAFFELLKNN